MYNSIKKNVEKECRSRVLNRLFRIEYVHNGKEYSDAVGHPGGYSYPQSIVLAILILENTYVVYTLGTGKGETGIMQIGFGDETDLESFED